MNIDKTPPNKPKFETYLDGNGIMMINIYDDGDNLAGVDKVWSKVPGQDWIAGNSTQYHKLPDGIYTISAKVTDKVGNESAVATFVFNNQNNKVKSIVTEISNMMKVNLDSNVLSIVKEVRNEIANKISSLETSSQKEFLEQKLYELDVKIAKYEGTNVEKIKTTEEKVRELFEDLKRYPKNQTIIDEINRLITSITDKLQGISL